MRFTIYPQSCVPIHAGSIEERPLGGIETAIIRVGEALHARGHSVTIYTTHTDPPASEPLYEHLSKASDMSECDVFICVREWIPLLSDIPSKVKLFWTGDAADQVQSFGIGDRRVAKRIDGFLAVSDWHAQNIAEESGFPHNKIHVIRNGIHLPLFSSPQKRQNKSLIYSSTPFRGLALLPTIFEAVYKEHPDATLNVYSGIDVYKSKNESAYLNQLSEKYKPVFDSLTAMDGVTVHGNVTQPELAKAFLQSQILCYPNIFPETSCISIMEAQAAGCVPVTSNLAALPETVGEAGVLVDGEPGSDAYIQSFIEVLNALLTDQDRLSELSLLASTRAKQQHSWQIVAERLERYLSNNFNLL